MPLPAKPSSMPPRRSRRSSHKKLWLIAAGVALVVIGVVGGILPVVPGTPMVLGGLALVSNHSSRGRLLRSRTMRWLRQRGIFERFPLVERLLRRLASAKQQLDQPAVRPSASTTFSA